MLPGGPYEGIPRGRSQNLPSSALGPVSVSTGQGGLMSAAPGSSVMGPGPPGAPVVSSALAAASGTGQVSSNPLKNGTLSGIEEEVRTLFVSGLPMDVRLRELYLLFRCYEGYEGSFLKLISSKPGKPPQPIAFVSFKLRKQAEKALSELQGVRFDPASSQTLRLEFARTNSRVSPKQQQQQPQQQPVQQHTQQQPAQSHHQQQQPYHHHHHHHHLQQQPQQPLQQPQQTQVGAGHHHQHHLTQQQQQQLSPHALHNAHSPHQHMAAMALGQNSTPQGYVSAFSGPNKSNSSLGYYFLPATLHAHQNAMAQGLYSMQDWSRMQMSYNAISHVSTPSPTLSPAPSTPHLSVLNILSDTDSSAAPSPTPDHSISAPTLPGSLSSSSSSLTSGSNSIAIAPQASTSDVVPSSMSPTSTLVVTNIDQSYSEEDVRSLFKDSQGFIQTKVQYNGGQMFGVVDFKDAECASEALERFQDMSLSSSSNNRSAGLIVYYAQAPNTENLDDGSLGTPPGGGIVAPPTTSTVAPPSSIPPIGNPSLGAIGTSSTGTLSVNPVVGSGSAAVGSGMATSANSMSIPQQVSIPIQYQNGHIEAGSMSTLELNQQMSELDLNMQPCPSPVLSVNNPGSSPSSGLPPQQGYVEYSPHMGGTSGGFGGQNFPSHQLMFSDNYPQGAVFLNNYTNPMMASWQFNPNINQGIK